MMMTRFCLITLALFAIFLSTNEGAGSEQICDKIYLHEKMHAEKHHHVDYSEGGKNWDKSTYGGICELHALEAPDQSPIDIKTEQTKKDEDKCDDGELDWEVEWDHKRFKVENNCHTLQVTAVDEHNNDLADSRDVIAKLKVDDTPFDDDKYEEYCLAQFHFHWGSDTSVGSEHMIDGHRFPLEVHFVHYACQFGNFLAAQRDGNASSWKHLSHAHHTLAVVSVLFEATGKDNPAFEKLLSSKILQKITVCLNEEHVYSDEIKILKELVPEKFEDGGYYAYEGGLTTPPCTDDVKWFIGKTFGYISPGQLERFRSLLDDDCKPILRNWRDVVDTTNAVYDCDEEDEEDEENENEKENGSEENKNENEKGGTTVIRN